MCGDKFLYQWLWHSLAKSCTKNYENPSIFVKVTAKKSVAPFFLDTVYEFKFSAENNAESVLRSVLQLLLDAFSIAKSSFVSSDHWLTSFHLCLMAFWRSYRLTNALHPPSYISSCKCPSPEDSSMVNVVPVLVHYEIGCFVSKKSLSSLDWCDGMLSCMNMRSSRA